MHGDHAAHCAGGGIVHHPVFLSQPGSAAWRIAGADDVRDAIALRPLRYDRVVACQGLPG